MISTTHGRIFLGVLLSGVRRRVSKMPSPCGRGGGNLFEEGTSMSRDHRWTRTCSAKGPRAAARHRVATNPGDVFGFFRFSRIAVPQFKTTPDCDNYIYLFSAIRSQSPYGIFQPESIQIVVFQPLFFSIFLTSACPTLPCPRYSHTNFVFSRLKSKRKTLKKNG